MGRTAMDNHRRNLKLFHRKSKYLLSDIERDYLHDVLRQYESVRDVKKLMVNLLDILDTPAKLDLLVEIRGLLPKIHTAQFDWLAPYAKMAHPVIVTGTQHGNVKHLRKSRSDGSVIKGTNGYHDNPSVSVRMVTVDKDRDAPGFSIQGGSENGRGIFISSVEPGSLEESLGLRVGDQILEVNNIGFDKITSSSAKMVLLGNSRLRLKVQQSGPVLGQRIAKEKTSWFDTVRRKIISGEFNDVDPSHAAMGGTRLLSRGDERRVIITTSSKQCIGFNIRGGMEYGVGIYISKVDKGGLAQAHGINVGDQIIDVNGVSTENTTHAQAVELIRNQPCLIMTIRSVNRYPAYKELCNEYGGIDKDTNHKRRHSSSPTSGMTPLTHNELIDAIPLEVAEQYTQTHTHNQSTDWLHNQSITMSPTPIPKSARPSVATETTTLIQKHMATEQSKPTVAQKTDARNDDYPVETTATSTTTPSKRIGRSHSMKFPGEKALPTFEAETQAQVKDSKRVQRNRTFREILFGMKMKSKDKKERVGKQRDRKLMPDSKQMKKRYPSSAAYGSLNKNPSVGQGHDSGNSKPLDPSHAGWATRKAANDRDPTANANPGNPTSQQHSKQRPSTAALQYQASSSDTQQQQQQQQQQQSAAFVHGAGTQLMYSEVRHASGMNVLDEMADKLLSEDEKRAVMRHVSRYHQEGIVENLVMPILVILDKPEKILLLRELRGVITASDLGRFDSMVSRKELQAYESLQFGRKDMAQPLNSMRRNSIGKPKKTILETKPDQEGKFFLQTREDIATSRRRQQELEELRLENERRASRYSQPDEDEDNDPATDTNSLHNSDIAMALFDKPGHSRDVSPISSAEERSGDAVPGAEEIVGCDKDDVVEKLPVILERIQARSSSESDLGSFKEAGSDASASGYKGGAQAGDRHVMPQILVSQSEAEEGKQSKLPRVVDEPDCNLSAIGNIDEMFDFDSSDDDNVNDDDDDDMELPNFGPNSSGSDKDSDLKSNHSGLYNLMARDSDSGQDANFSTVTSPAWSSPNAFSPISEVSLPPTPVSSLGSPSSPVIPKTPPNTDRSPSNHSLSASPKDEPIYAKVDLSHKRTRGSSKVNLSVEGSVDGSMDGSESGRRSPFKVTFTEYRESPVTSRKGILKNSFRSEDAPKVEKKRGSSDYMDIDDINLGEPEPFREIDADAKSHKAPSPLPSRQDEVMDQLQAGMETMTVALHKNRSSLGISVSGGRDSKNQPEVRIDRVFPGGAASDDGILQAGCEVVSVDGQSLHGVTHPEAVDIIRKAYHDKTRKTIEFVVRQPLELDTHL